MPLSASDVRLVTLSVMGAVAAGAIFFGFLALVAAGFVWQSVRRSPATEYAEYLIDDAVLFVHDRLSETALEVLDTDLVRQILEWNLNFTQIVAPRALGHPPVIGGGDGIEYVMDRARAVGVELEPIDIAEVMAIETEYLLEIGAIGEPVDEETQS
jgi:hypothetical protein